MEHQSVSSSLRLAIFGSGKGSNARALLEFAKRAPCHYEPVLLLSDVAEAGILALGEEFDIATRFFHPGPLRTRFSKEREEELVSLLREANIDLIALAGFLRIIQEPLLLAFPKRILNIHPSLLPHFPGLRAWEQAIEAKVKESGCTVHLVDDGIDTGTILGQQCVPLLQNDTAKNLHARIQEAERELYPRILDRFAKHLLEK